MTDTDIFLEICGVRQGRVRAAACLALSGEDLRQTQIVQKTHVDAVGRW